MSVLPHWFIPSLLPLHLVRTSNSNTPQPSINPTSPLVSAIKAYVQTLKMQGKDKAEVLQTLKLCYEGPPKNVASIELEDF